MVYHIHKWFSKNVIYTSFVVRIKSEPVLHMENKYNWKSSLNINKQLAAKRNFLGLFSLKKDNEQLTELVILILMNHKFD